MHVEILKTYNLPVHSFLLTLCATDDTDPCIFVVRYAVTNPSENSSSSSSTGSTDGSEGSSDSSSTPLDTGDACTVYPDRSLEAIASWEDMHYMQKGPVSGELSRVAVVSLMFKSKETLEQVLEEITADIRILARILTIPVILNESIVFVDDNDAVDEDSVYWMPEE